MSTSTESPTFTEALPPTAPDDGPDGRAFPGRVRGQRLEITPADLTMYSAITGRAPSQAERERALTWSEADPMHEQIAEAAGGSVSPAASSASTAVVPVRVMRRWHPAALSLRLREMWFNGVSIRVNRPQISHWLRRLSLALQQGQRRVRQVR